MLPFLKKRQEAGISGVLIKHREPDEKPAEEQQDDPAAAIKACSQALIKAVHAQDVEAVSEALKDAFDILDSMPHVEGEHLEPHSYEAQNQKAAE